LYRILGIQLQTRRRPNIKTFSDFYFILKVVLRPLIRENIHLNLAYWKSDYLLQFPQSSVAIAPELKIKFGAGAVEA
jgi:hypothetical protein